nr:hypothetical protein [uncultured Duganella sp.]
MLLLGVAELMLNAGNFMTASCTLVGVVAFSFSTDTMVVGVDSMAPVRMREPVTTTTGSAAGASAAGAVCASAAWAPV